MDPGRPGERGVSRDAEEASKGARFWRIAVYIVLGFTAGWGLWVLLTSEWASQL